MDRVALSQPWTVWPDCQSYKSSIESSVLKGVCDLEVLTKRSANPFLVSVHLCMNLAARSDMPSREGCLTIFVLAYRSASMRFLFACCTRITVSTETIPRDSELAGTTNVLLVQCRKHGSSPIHLEQVIELGLIIATSSRAVNLLDCGGGCEGRLIGGDPHSWAKLQMQ